MPDSNNSNVMRERLKLRKTQIALGRAARAQEQASTFDEPRVAHGAAFSDAVAIVGLSGYLPAAMTVADFWRYLDEDRSVISEIPADRFDWSRYYDPSGRDPAKMRTKRGAFIPDIRGFDREFFGILPDEADLLDPQLRLLLMSVYQTIEDAGCAPDSLRKSRTGIYVAAEDNEYLQHLIRAGVDLGVNGLNHHPSMLANRLSYFFDLRGPSEIVNTMCASAAVALHRAVTAIRSGEIERAIVGAARVIVRPEPLIGLSRMRVLSAGDSVRSFGRDADGYIRAEGIASVMLEPLSRALANRHRIYALIKSTATNYNGKGGMSIAAPNVEAHVDVIRSCYQQAGVDPRDIAYIEAQGMGNQVGDIAEWEACNRALEQLCKAQGRDYDPGFCRVSTLKPMLGHMECTSALGALFKIIRSFQTDRIHEIIGLEEINPYLEVDGRPCRLVQRTEVWPRTERPRLAGLHSYGSGGNNAHVLIEEYVPPALPPPAPRAHRHELIVVSAKSAARLRQQVAAIAAHVAQHDVPLASIAWTLQVGRDAFPHRAAFVVTSADDFAETANTFLANKEVPGVFRGVASNHRSISAHEPLTLEANELGEVARAWVAGQAVRWPEVPADAQACRVSLPTYPFDLQPCWIDASGRPAVDTRPAVDSSTPAAESEAPETVDNKSLINGRISTESNRRPKRICVIGAGPSGLVMAKSLLEEGHEPVIFEKQRTLGGLWLLNRNKTAGAYQKTRFQSSKFTSVFSDFYADDIASTFYSVDDVSTYLRRYADAFGLHERIHYDSEVVSVSQAQGRWRVELRRHGTILREEFDGVALCQGSFWHPHIPKKKGLERFQGEVLHSGEYFDNTRFRGKRVLVIGGGVSAMDIAEEAAHVASAVYWSRRTNKLILPRMVGFVPNDCQSPASLLIPENRYNIIERLSRSMPDYFEQYRRSGILPSVEEFRANPVVHINDAIVGLIADGKIKAIGDVERFDERGCVFEGARAEQAEIDVVVFATGYKNFGAEDARYAFLDNVSMARDFAMGIFYDKNPTLVNTAVLPIAFTGSFYFSEMVARWYAQILSGSYTLTEQELAHRITDEHYLIMAPVSSVLFGLKLGLFPRPETEFREFWRLLNYPAFPMIYRLRGPHAKADAPAQLERFRQLAYVRTDELDPALRTLKERILAGLNTLDELLRTGEITQAEYEGALRQRHNPLILDWEAQYIKRLSGPPQEAVIQASAESSPLQPDPSRIEERLTAALAKMVSRLLRIDPAAVAPERNLSEYGFDSIALTGFASEISQQFDFVRLDPSTFLEHSTLASLVGFLARKYPSQFAQQFQPETQPAPARASIPAAMPRRPAPGPTPHAASGPAPHALSRPTPRAPSRPISEDDIAVIGFSGRFPGATSVAGFWQNLVHGRSAITDIPSDRWSWKEHWGDPHKEPNKTDCIYGAFLDSIGCFEPRHFDISPREAVYMDPQHRMLLEVAWETMEIAGYTRARLHDRKIGLFIGVEKQDYVELIKDSGQPLDGHMNPGNAHSMLANRISRFFSWRGPSLVIDTACSGASTALRLAFDQLRQGSIEMAFVGGVNVLLTPSLFILNRQLGMLTNEPVIRPFDRKAAGHLNGEAAALVLLKPLSAAIRDGDTIYSVIRSIAVQHGGRGVHLMAPNAASHREVIEEAIDAAGLGPQDIDYIEAQGTGNPLTDRMELSTYQRVFSALPPGTVRLGTSKGHVGHLGAASGVVALIKTILSIRNKKLTGILNLDDVNWDAADGPLPVRLVTQAEDWPQTYVDGKPAPRRAGIHNYGFGGVNAHTIVEEYLGENNTRSTGDHVIVLSARTSAQVAALATTLREFLERKEYQAWGFSELTLEEIAFALQCSREAWAHRVAIVASSLQELIAKLAAHGHTHADHPEGTAGHGAFHGVVDETATRHWRMLLDEEERRAIVRNAVAQRNMTKLALLWVQGVDVPWDELYQGRAVRRVPLPTYPFTKERYWIDTSERKGSRSRGGHGDTLQPALVTPRQPVQPTLPDQEDDAASIVIRLLSRITEIPRHELTPMTALTELGIDSLLMTQLVNHLERERAIRLTVAESRQCQTVNDLVRLVRAHDANRAIPSTAAPAGLELLQRGAGLAPTFWFHAAFGTIQLYVPLAHRIGNGLPFYAIPARGMRDGEKPFDNIIEMASHYRKLVQASGWRGSFQLGGYSQGGVVAYEVARQLQEEGHSVDNLVLVDAPFPPVTSLLTRPYHLALAFLNILDMSGLARAGDLESFVARQEETLISYLVDVGLRRGLKYSAVELTAVIQKYVAIMEANLAAMRAYQLIPLPRTEEVACHYIARRDAGAFFPAQIAGLREVDEQNRFYAQRECVRRWSEWLPGLTVHRTTAPDHFALMEEDGALDVIAAVCRQLYRVEA